MKKIIVTGAIALSCIIATNAFSQETAAALSNNKKELGREKKEIKAEEKTIRKEDKALKQTEVSYMTRQKFYRDFPDAKNPGFSVGKNFDEISYTLNNQAFVAYYDLQSNLVGTVAPQQITDLPLAAQKTIAKKYGSEGYEINRVILFDDNEANSIDMYLYDQRFNDTDTYFVEMEKGTEKLILKVDIDGDVFLFKKM
ncbi:MAG: hypothetical protein WDN26_20470 [Chitinophagaceae bacterium]